MARQCGDCLYFMSERNYCNKNKQTISGCEYPDEHPACGYFVADDRDVNCYQCTGRKDGLLGGFYCKTLNKRIDRPAYWTCNRFCRDYS